VCTCVSSCAILCHIQPVTMKTKMAFFTKMDSRKRSLYIVHLSMLIFSLGNSIIFTGVWPYLQEVFIIKIYFIYEHPSRAAKNYKCLIYANV
jgi:hypothetical protein